ncbi:hypothetical protein HPB47_026305 [Ixodes persulcatus]|uniref:Uncharacterized protein n=1 Tax=Ixodes persulcatus TaxID=34615 RepID=A0AC60Q0X5_IXOPE|nr:hypothetical protein HPB47_026305 [Ixodes persulcatus]
MIDYARRHFDHSHITYETLNIAHDVSRFLQTHGTFDRVYSFYCLHWIKDQRTAFANIARLLAPDGECLLQFCARTPVYALWRSLSSVLPVAGDAAAEEKRELYSAMSAEMLRRCKKGPEGFSAEFDVYVVHASKPSSTP